MKTIQCTLVARRSLGEEAEEHQAEEHEAGADDEVSADGAATRARGREALYGRGAPWRHVFDDGVVPQPFSDCGIMGTLMPMSVVDVLRALAPAWGDVFLDVGVGHGAMLGAMHQVHLAVELRGVDTDPKLVEAARANMARLRTSAQLAVRSVHEMRDLGEGVTLAYSFCDGLRPADALAALIAACHRTPTLRRACLVHNAVVRHALREHVEALDARVVRYFPVFQAGSGAQYRAWVLDLEAARRLGVAVPEVAAERVAHGRAWQRSRAGGGRTTPRRGARRAERGGGAVPLPS